MKKLAIRLSDIIDYSNAENRAIRKSVEFFLGSVSSMDEILDFKYKYPDLEVPELIDKILTSKGVFLRQQAIIKKFKEYLVGREFDGFIDECSLIIDNKKIKNLSSSFAVTFYASMENEVADFLVSKFKLSCQEIVPSNSFTHEIEKNTIIAVSSDHEREALTKKGLTAKKIQEILV